MTNSKKHAESPEDFLERVHGAFNGADFCVPNQYLRELCHKYKINDVAGIKAMSELDYAGTKGFQTAQSNDKPDWGDDAKSRMYQRRFGLELLIQSIDTNPKSCESFCKDNGVEEFRRTMGWGKQVLKKETEILNDAAYRERISKEYELIRPLIIRKQQEVKHRKYGG